MFLFCVVRQLPFFSERVKTPDAFVSVQAQFLDVGTNETLHKNSRRQEVIAVLFEKLQICHSNLGVLGDLLETLASFLSEIFEVFSEGFHKSNKSVRYWSALRL